MQCLASTGLQNSVNFGRHFLFSLSLYLETKMLNSLSHILVIWVFWHFSTACYGTVWFTFGGFSTGYSTWYFFSTTSSVVPSDPYHYQNVTCKLYWSLIGRRKSSVLCHRIQYPVENPPKVNRTVPYHAVEKRLWTAVCVFGCWGHCLRSLVRVLVAYPPTAAAILQTPLSKDRDAHFERQLTWSIGCILNVRGSPQITF